MSNSQKEKKRKKSAPLLEFFKKLQKSCNTYKDSSKWSILVDELEGLVGKHPDIVPFSDFKSHLDEAKDLTSNDRSEIEKACALLLKHLRATIEDYLDEPIEKAMESISTRKDSGGNKNSSSKTTIAAIGGGVGSAAAIGIIVFFSFGSFDFNFYADNSYATVNPGGEANFPISIRHEGTSQLIKLSCNENYDNISCELDPSNVFPPDNVSLKISTTSQVEPRNDPYQITITGWVESMTKEKTFNLKVNSSPENQPPPPPPQTKKLTISPQNPQGAIYSSPKIILLVNIFENPPVENVYVKFFLDGNFLGSDYTDSDGRASYEIESISPGSHTWFVTTQKSNYEDSKSLSRSFIYSKELESKVSDNIPPTIFINSPQSGSVVNSNPYSISGKANDSGSGIDKVEVKTQNSSYIKTQGTTSWSINLPLEEGENTITAKAFDKNGNSKTDSIILTLDTVKPQVVGTPDRDYDFNNYYTSPVTITWSVKDPNGKNYSCTKPTFYSGPDTNETPLEGSCTDNANNQGTGKFNMRYDSTPPTVFVKPERDPDFNGWYNHAVKLTWTGTDDGSGINPSTCDSYIYQGGPTLEYNYPGKCADFAGNEVTSYILMKYDSIEPSVPQPKEPSGQIFDNPPKFTWQKSNDDGAVTYTVYYIKENRLNFDSPLILYNGPNTSYVANSLFEYNVYYLWYVKATDQAGNESKMLKTTFVIRQTIN